MKHILIKTIPKRENIVARDLCDCLYFYQPNVECRALSTGRVYVYVDTNSFEKCYNLKYFKKLIKSFEVFDEVYLQEPSCVECCVVKVGAMYFVRRAV
ncbi:MAG: DUF3195 domain-containing protein [Pyrobaculum sp.]